MSVLCRVADVSRKCYYNHLRHPAVLEDEEVLAEIRGQQESQHGGIGYRQMARLVSKGLGKEVNRKHVLRLMKENGLLSAVRRKKYPDEVYARRRQLRASVPPDLIRRDFFALEPRKRLVEDITYLYGREKKMYLNTIADLFNGEILACRISDCPDSRLCVDTVELLCRTWGECFEGTVLHDDLGATYVSYEYMDAVKAHGTIQSVGKVASCYDNAAMEYLNGIIKTEALYCRFGKTNVKERRVPIDDIVEAVVSFIDYYNNGRPKEALGGLSPVEFRLQNPRGTFPVVIG